MFYLNYILLIYVILNLFKYSNEKYIKIPIQKAILTKPNISEEEVLNFLTSKIYTTNIKMGTPYQDLKLNIIFKSTFSFVYTDETRFSMFAPQNMIKFITKNSSTLKAFRDDSSIDINGNLYDIIKDNIIFNNQTLEDFTILEGNFMYITLNDTSALSGELGLCDTDYSNFKNNEENFIYNLKSKNIINSYNFFIEFENDTNGEVIIGVDPNEYNNKKYNYTTNTFERHPNIFQTLYLGFNIDKVSYNNININMDIKYAIFEIENGIIQAGNTLKNILKKDFFNDLILNNTCKEKTYLINTFFICKKGLFDNSKLGLLSIYNQIFDYTFNIDLSKLFFNYENYSYFLIGFCGNIDYIILNDLFLRNNTFVFNIDQKITKFYNPFLKQKKNNRTIFYLFLVCVILIIIIGLILFIYYKKNKHYINKKKGVELVEDLEYMTIVNK